MSETTVELIKLLLAQKDVDKAIITANKIITDYQMQHESSQEAFSSHLRDDCQNH